MLKNTKRNLLAMLFILASVFMVPREIYGATEDRVYEAENGKRVGVIEVEYSYYEDENERHKITGRNNTEVFRVQNPVNIKDSAKALAYLKPEPEIPSGNWRKNSTGWWYQFSNGTYLKNRWEKINNKWYYFNNKGYIEKGWTKVKNKWYYLNSSGAMQTGWTKVKNKWYYLN